MSWGMIGAAAITVVGGMLSKKGSKSGSSSAGYYDPYAPYRGAAAQKLNALMADPSTIQTLPEYQADMQAAARTMAAQGYTGSGNALVAAANVGGQAYQQAFNNLAMLSGASSGPAQGAGMAAQQQNYQQQQQNQMWGQIGNTIGGIINQHNQNNNQPYPQAPTPPPYSGSYASGGGTGGGSYGVAVGTYAPAGGY